MGETTVREETYDFFWKNVFLKQIDTTTRELDELCDATKVYHLCTKNLEECKERICKGYEKNRDVLKQRFFYTKHGQEKEEQLIDIHKIGASFCQSMIQNKIYCFDLREDVPIELFLCNYTLAYMVSVGIVYENLLGIYKNKYNKNPADEKYARLQQQGCFIMPPTNPGHDPYAIGRIKTLALNDIYGIDFDLLTYADMLYWIEAYNKALIEKGNLFDDYGIQSLQKPVL
jgi:hypothetical protein